MKFPWSKRIEKEKSQAEALAIAAAEEYAYSIQQRMDAENVKETVVQTTRKLRNELDRNGWTQLLQESMGGAR